MTLRFKAFLIVLITEIGLIVLLYSVSAYFLLGGFQRIEAQETQQNVGRAVDALTAKSAYLKDKSSDWALWDDAYNFMQDGNPEFIRSNLTDDSLRSLQINLILFVRDSGELAASWSFDLDNNRRTPVPSFFANFSATDFVRLHRDMDGVLAGTLLLPEGPLMVVARPILTSAAQGPAHGMLIMGQFLNASVISDLSDTTHLGLSIVLAQDSNLAPDTRLEER